MASIAGGKKNAWKLYIILLVLAYIPFLGLLLSNSAEPRIAGIPLVWFYSMVWVLFVFTLIVIVYFIDRKVGGIIE